MFKLIGVLNNCLSGTIVKAVAVIDVNLDSCLTLSRTGNKDAQQDGQQVRSAIRGRCRYRTRETKNLVNRGNQLINNRGTL